MNRNYKFRAILAIGLIFIFASAVVQARAADYAFVIFETAVTKKGVETSDQNPEERRFYVSNVVVFPETDPYVFRNSYKEADAYFTSAVVEPMEAKGIVHKYYDDDIRINDKVVYELKGRAEVEELQKKVLQDLKAQNANVFTFTWVRNAKTKNLETSRPTLFYHGPEQPLYGVSDTQTSATKETQNP